MTPDSPRRPPRPANQEVLKARNDNTEDKSAVHRCVVEMRKACIEARVFMEASLYLDLVENMIFKLQSDV